VPRAEKGEINQAIGRSRGGRTTKIHALADHLCRPVAFLLTGGQVADCVAADALLDQMLATDTLNGDKGYDSDAVRRKIESKGAAPNIPPKANRRWKNCFSPTLLVPRLVVTVTARAHPPAGRHAGAGGSSRARGRGRARGLLSTHRLISGEADAELIVPDMKSRGPHHLAEPAGGLRHGAQPGVPTEKPESDAPGAVDANLRRTDQHPA
jgi:hypothetical protein